MKDLLIDSFHDELEKIAFSLMPSKPLSMMSVGELRKERNDLTKRFYSRDLKSPTIGGISGATAGAVMSKITLGKGMIPAAAVGGLLGATVASNVRKKRLLKRIRVVSNQLRRVQAPITHAKSKKRF